MLLKVGELAKRSGLTVRTLHHYDAIGLLTPSARADNGYRLYNREDVARQLMAGLAMSQIMHGRRSAPPDVGLSVSAIAGGTKMSGARDAARRSALDPHVA